MSVSQAPLETVADPLAFTVSEVTGMRTADVKDIDGHRTAADVAASMAAELELPANTPQGGGYALLHDESARMMRDDAPLGSQIKTGTHLTVIPKSRLG